jgi:uncharacterized membrane protein
MSPIIVGALLGAVFLGSLGGSWWFMGLLAGALTGCIMTLRALEKQVRELSLRLERTAAAPPRVRSAAAAPPAGARYQPEPEPWNEEGQGETGLVPEPVPAPVAAPRPYAAPEPVPAFAHASPSPVLASAPRPRPRPGPGPLDPVLEAVRRYFTTGNVVARVGAVVLFFGIAFFLKYAVDRDFIPLGARFGGAWAAGAAFVAGGLRLRARGGYGQILQGAGIGTLYLTTYVALKPYGLILPVAAFAVLAAVAVLAGVLALVQDSRALATVGTLGGFLAPVLTSPGEGGHVVLLSYYALLNLGILALAWRRAWRELNLLGFVFTFVVASLWGWRAYQPEFFGTTQPFLAFFWLLYVAVAVLFSARRSTGKIGYLDGTLVFGVPTAGFILQAALVGDLEQGLTVSALVAAVVYLGVARGLELKGGEPLEPLRLAFIALGVAFATLAVPLAFDGSWLASTWALEGAALVWVGARQGGRLARAAGVALQLFAGFALLVGAGADPTVPVLNGPCLAMLAVSFAGLASAYFLRARASTSLVAAASPLLLGWGLLWWLGAGISQITIFAPASDFPNLLMLFAALSALALDAVARRLDWKTAGYPAMALLPALAAMLPAMLAESSRANLLTGWGAVGWAVAGAAHLALLRRRESHWPPAVVRSWHLGGLLLALVLLARESAWAMEHLAGMGGAWPLVAWVVVPTMAVYLLPRARGLGWPVGRFPAEYAGSGPAIAAAALAAWVLAVTVRGDAPAPLPYIPLLHPLEVAQAAVLAAIWLGWTRLRREEPFKQVPAARVPVALGMMAFLAINGALARAVHAYVGVPYTWEALFGDRVFHAGLSILWSTLALGIMVAGSRRAVPALWFSGSALLTLVVLKLFFVELGGAGTVARIVSFVAVGLLMLLIGYLAPMPLREPDPRVELPPA